MTKTKTNPSKNAGPVLCARCTKKQKKRVRDAIRSTGMNETDFVLAAIDELFAKYPTPKEQIAAVSNYRVKAAAA